MNAPADAAAHAGARVLAAVVTFNPGPELQQNLAATRAECEHVLVIDNGSRDLAHVERAVGATGCTLLANHANLGIAKALEQAARHAREHGYDWLLTLDQDSTCPPGAIRGLLALYAAHPQRARIGMVCLAQRDRSTGREYHHFLDIVQETPRWRVLRSAITSGSLLRVAVLPQPAFDERLFIDFVDHDFCLRLRRGGHIVLEDREHVLLHSIGASTRHTVLGKELVTTNHPPVRTYYITRNRLQVCFANLLFDPVWSLKGLAQMLSGLALILLFEQAKLAKLKFMARGIVDFARRRFGPWRAGA